MKNKLFILAIVLGLSVQFATAQAPKLKIGNNPTVINGSAAIEIESTNRGLLVSRLTASQRDAIATPAAGLLIYNTSNNTFEVYKSSCSCWVTVNDGGNSPSTNVENTAPTVTSLNFSGAAIVGKPITLNYTYEDKQNDPQGNTTILWQVAITNSGADVTTISGATTVTYTPAAIDSGRWIRAIVTPRATTGVLNGVQTFSDWQLVESSTIPTANNIVVTGTPQQGSLLTGTYTFAGGSGTEDTNVTTGSADTWQTALTNTGVGIVNAPLYGSTQYNTTYRPQSDLLGRYIRFGVRAKDNAGLQATNFVFSPWVGPITAAPDTAPVANNVSFSPNPAVNSTLTASYTFFDANNDAEGGSTFQWYRADSATGTNSVAIAGATSLTYIPTSADQNKFLGIGVTPKSLTGANTTGSQVIYYHPSAVLSAAAFTFTSSSIKQLPFFAVNRTMNTLNAIQVEIDVTAIGGITFSTNTVNGYSFSANYTATVTGIQWVTLTATGTQVAYNASGDNFTITGVASSTLTKSINIFNSITGAALTTYSNGTENFSSNTNCTNALISTGYNSSTCTGNVTVGSNSYPVVLINGQCWMQTNLKEAPTAPCAAAINTGCNVWINSSAADVGSYGFYNTTTTNGSAGWATTEPAANEGSLYQWSAAMNGATTERAKGVCPNGFHIPSDCEWMYLEHGLGLSISNQNIMGGWRNNTGEGNKLKASGNNSSNFSALLNGSRDPSGTFFNRTVETHIWTSSPIGNNAIRRLLGSNTGVSRSHDPKINAFSVRCLKD